CPFRNERWKDRRIDAQDHGGRERKAQQIEPHCAGEEHLAHDVVSSLLTSVRGSRTVMIVPFPSCVSTSMRPPCASAIFFTWKSPTPHPPFLVDWKGTNSDF